MEVGASFSTGHTAIYHNFRYTHTQNVDPELSADNVVIVNKLLTAGQKMMSINEYTDKRMQPVIDEYNSKQKRKDRRITQSYSDYFRSKGNNHKRDLSMEYVAQYGNHSDLGGEYYDSNTSAERREEIRAEYISVYNRLVDNLQKKYPHLEIIYAVIHFDEPMGTPHMHIGVQPIGEGYRQGLSQQVSLGKALELDGVERIKSREEHEKEGGFQLVKFYNRFRHEEFEPILTDLGYEIKEEIHGRKHEEPSMYAAGMAEVAAAREEVAAERAALSENRKKLEQEIQAQRALSEADIPPEIPIEEREIKVGLMKTETVATVVPEAVRDVESQLRATKKELEAVKKERDELKPQASALRRIMDVILRPGTVFSKIDSIKEICREFSFFRHLEEKKRLDWEAAYQEPQTQDSIPAWEPSSKGTTAEKRKNRQTRRNPWGIDIQ